MATRSQYLKERIAVCKANLAKPNVIYPNGRWSHDVEREDMARSESELMDLAIDCGLWAPTATGMQFVGFDEERA